MSGPSPALVTQGEDFFFIIIIDFSPRQDLQRGEALRCDLDLLQIQSTFLGVGTSFLNLVGLPVKTT